MKGRRINKFEKMREGMQKKRRLTTQGRERLTMQGGARINVWLWIWGEGGNQKTKRNADK